MYYVMSYSLALFSEIKLTIQKFKDFPSKRGCMMMTMMVMRVQLDD